MAPDLQRLLDHFIVERNLAKYEPGAEFEVLPGTYHISQMTGMSCLMKVLATRRKIIEDMKEGVQTRQIEIFRAELPLMRLADRGDVIHKHITEVALKESPGRVLEADVPVRRKFASQTVPRRTFELVGHADMHDVSDNGILELKSVKHEAFVGFKNVRGVKDEPKKEHLLQANAYAVLLNADHYTVAYIDSQEFQIVEHTRQTDVNLFDVIVDNADLLFYSEISGKLHPRLKSMQVEEWKCRNCPVTGECEVE